MAQPIRRIVTGHDAEGKSVIIEDANSPHSITFEHSGTTVTDIWKTTSIPADNLGNKDAAKGEWRKQPPKDGSVFRVIEYPPDSKRLANFDRAKHLAETGESPTDEAKPRHPGMHKTNSTDYAIVLSGEIYAIMEDGEVLMKAGDCLVQRGTNHAWSNRTEKPCLVAFVLIDAHPAP
jgi:mannose-6-phosphate isomerase-like protein (cupin superfamily)